MKRTSHEQNVLPNETAHEGDEIIAGGNSDTLLTPGKASGDIAPTAADAAPPSKDVKPNVGVTAEDQVAAVSAATVAGAQAPSFDWCSVELRTPTRMPSQSDPCISITVDDTLKAMRSGKVIIYTTPKGWGKMQGAGLFRYIPDDGEVRTETVMQINPANGKKEAVRVTHQIGGVPHRIALNLGSESRRLFFSNASIYDAQGQGYLPTPSVHTRASGKCKSPEFSIKLWKMDEEGTDAYKIAELCDGLQWIAARWRAQVTNRPVVKEYGKVSDIVKPAQTYTGKDGTQRERKPHIKTKFDSTGFDDEGKMFFGASIETTVPGVDNEMVQLDDPLSALPGKGFLIGEFRIFCMAGATYLPFYASKIRADPMESQAPRVEFASSTTAPSTQWSTSIATGTGWGGGAPSPAVTGSGWGPTSAQATTPVPAAKA